MNQEPCFFHGGPVDGRQQVMQGASERIEFPVLVPPSDRAVGADALDSRLLQGWAGQQPLRFRGAGVIAGIQERWWLIPVWGCTRDYAAAATAEYTRVVDATEGLSASDIGFFVDTWAAYDMGGEPWVFLRRDLRASLR